jgi:glycosyltransferase involved in cell wall biosynthesis
MLARSADLVLAVNDRHAELVRARYRPGAVHTLRDAAEAELDLVPPADRALLGIPEAAIAVGFLGSLVYGRLDPIIAAWTTLATSDAAPALALVIVGDGPDLGPYRRRADEAGWLGRSVFFVGSLPRHEALAVMRACDIAYSECWTEAGFPSKLFEYMALGMPIVTEAKPQTIEVLEEGRDALFFRSADELARHIRRLADDLELRRQLGRNARETLVRAHTVDRRQREFEALLDGPPNAAPSQRLGR